MNCYVDFFKVILDILDHDRLVTKLAILQPAHGGM